jgi:hypothetical protein
MSPCINVSCFACLPTHQATLCVCVCVCVCVCATAPACTTRIIHNDCTCTTLADQDHTRSMCESIGIGRKFQQSNVPYKVQIKAQCCWSDTFFVASSHTTPTRHYPTTTTTNNNTSSYCYRCALEGSFVLCLCLWLVAGRCIDSLA